MWLGTFPRDILQSCLLGKTRDGEGGDGKARQAVTTVVSVSGYGDWQGVPVELNR